MTRSDSNEIIKLKIFNFSIDLDFNFDNLIKNKNLIELLNFIKPEWQELELIKYHVFTEGITNRLVGFSYGKNLNTDSFLMRIYGHNTELFIDRNSEIKNICKLNEFGLSSPIFCAFKNGICYAFMPGRPLCKEELRQNNSLTERIARQLARLHSITSPSDNPTDSCLPKLFGKMFKILKEYASNFIELLNEIGIEDINGLENEADEILKIVYKLNSPIVFCHNDLLMKNIIYDNDSDKLFFIDFEYSDYNFQSFDIANHFCEYGGQDPFQLDLYPTKEHQLKWISNYLKYYDEFTGLSNNKINNERIEIVYDQVQKSSLLSHLLWGCWSLLQSQYSDIDFDFKNYAKERLSAYLKMKKTIF